MIREGRIVPGWVKTLAAAVEREPSSDVPVATPHHARAAAVLLAVADGPAGPDLLLTERGPGLRDHPGQLAFPGGAIEPTDGGPVEAAVREAREETGLVPDALTILGNLAVTVLRQSAFIVTPVVAWWHHPSAVAPVDRGEVAAVYRIGVRELAHPANRMLVHSPNGRIGPGFQAHGLFIWGFTARLTDQLLRIGGWEQSWDRSRRVPLPPAAMRARPNAGDPALRCYNRIRGEVT